MNLRAFFLSYQECSFPYSLTFFFFKGVPDPLVPSFFFFCFLLKRWKEFVLDLFLSFSLKSSCDGCLDFFVDSPPFCFPRCSSEVVFDRSAGDFFCCCCFRTETFATAKVNMPLYIFYALLDKAKFLLFVLLLFFERSMLSAAFHAWKYC